MNIGASGPSSPTLSKNWADHILEDSHETPTRVSVPVFPKWSRRAKQALESTTPGNTPAAKLSSQEGASYGASSPSISYTPRSAANPNKIAQQRVALSPLPINASVFASSGAISQGAATFSPEYFSTSKIVEQLRKIVGAHFQGISLPELEARTQWSSHYASFCNGLSLLEFLQLNEKEFNIDLRSFVVRIRESTEDTLLSSLLSVPAFHIPLDA